MSRTLSIACCTLVVLLKSGHGSPQQDVEAGSHVVHPETAVLAERLVGAKRARVVTHWGPFELVDPRIAGVQAIGYRRAWLYGLYDPLGNTGVQLRLRALPSTAARAGPAASVRRCVAGADRGSAQGSARTSR